MPARVNQNMDFSNEQLQLSVVDKSAGQGFDTQQNSHLASANGIEFEAPGDSLMGQIHLPHDYDWYSLSFEEAGVEQFAGLEPSTLFQRGWSSFG
jgi:hypothetical protein